MITSSPKGGEVAATTDSIDMLEMSLNRKPFDLKSNWTNGLRIINISFCNLERSGTPFKEILDNNKIRLRELYLRECCLTEDDTYYIARSLQGNDFLRVLVLDNNEVGNSAERFAKSLKSNTTLERLSLYDTSIRNIKCFADLFPSGGYGQSSNKSLIELQLDFNSNYSSHLKTIQKGLYRNLQNRKFVQRSGSSSDISE